MADGWGRGAGCVCAAPTHTAPRTKTAEIIMLDHFTVVFRASGDALFYVVGDANEVGRVWGGRDLDD